MSSPAIQSGLKVLPRASSSQATRWLAIAAAVSSLVVLPTSMVIANKSAPFCFILAAVLANAAALSSMSARDLLDRYRVILSTGPACLALILIVMAVASSAWTIDGTATWRGLAETLPEIVAAGCLAAAWPAIVRRSHLALLKYGLAAALILILFEALVGMPLHHTVGARAEDYDLKRSVVPAVLLLWPCAEFGFRKNKHVWVFGLGAVTLLAAVLAHSSASVVALVLSTAIYFAARRWSKLTLLAVAIAAFILLAAAPWTGVITERVLRPAGVALLARQHADVRVGIWTNFGRHVRERLWLGHGFDASLMVAESPKLGHADDIPMSWSVHPHSILLQVWVEFGVIGAVVALIAIVFCAIRLARLPDRQRAFRLAFAGSAATVALVGLNAWAPWWLAVASLGLVLFYLVEEQERGHVSG